jgi:hypothetical protein
MAKKLWLISFLMVCAALVFAQDSTAYHGKAGVADVADEDPGLFIVMMIVLVGLITSIILGLIVISVLFFSVTALVAGGIVSFSVVMGIYHKSIRTGIKSLVYIAATLLGGGAGIIGYFLFIMFRHSHFQIQYPLLMSFVGGMLGGMIGGWIALRLIVKVYERFKPKGQSII